MITTGTKWFVGLGVVSFILAAAYGWSSGGTGYGPVSLGYKGGVGDHYGYGLLMAAAIGSIMLGFVSTAVRDSSAEAEAEVAGVASLPPARPAAVSYWPVAGAFGLALVVIGAVADQVLVIFGAIVLGATLVEWTVQTWAENATGDPATNRRLRNRIMSPVEFPVVAVLTVAVVAVSLSRVFLAVSELNAVWVACGVATVVLLGGWFVAARPKMGSNAIAGLLVLFALVVIGVGIGGVVAGERPLHEDHPVTNEEQLEEDH